MGDPHAALAVKAGQVLFRQGELMTHCFVVKSGQVELFRTVGDREQRIVLLGAGDLFGEAALVENRVAGLGARAVTDSTLVKVEGAAFAEVVRQRPEVGLLALRRLAARGAAECAAWASLQDEAAQPARPTTEEAPMPLAAVPARGAGPEAGSPGPRLVHPETGTMFALPDHAEALVGRADPRTKFRPDIELSGVDTQRSLSRRHARVTRVEGTFAVVEEPRVANGTFVNGRRLTAGEPMAIKDGDEVCFGLVRTIFRAR